MLNRWAWTLRETAGNSSRSVPSKGKQEPFVQQGDGRPSHVTNHPHTEGGGHKIWLVDVKDNFLVVNTHSVTLINTENDTHTGTPLDIITVEALGCTSSA